MKISSLWVLRSLDLRDLDMKIRTINSQCGSMGVMVYSYDSFLYSLVSSPYGPPIIDIGPIVVGSGYMPHFKGHNVIQTQVYLQSDDLATPLQAHFLHSKRIHLLYPVIPVNLMERCPLFLLSCLK